MLSFGLIAGFKCKLLVQCGTLANNCIPVTFSEQFRSKIIGFCNQKRSIVRENCIQLTWRKRFKKTILLGFKTKELCYKVELHCKIYKTKIAELGIKLLLNDHWKTHKSNFSAKLVSATLVSATSEYQIVLYQEIGWLRLSNLMNQLK